MRRRLGIAAARFTVAVSPSSADAASDVAAALGYRVETPRASGGIVLLDLTWNRGGYRSSSSAQPRDLAAAFRSAGVPVLAVSSPSVADGDADRWRVVATNADDAPRLDLWLESRGRGGYRVIAEDHATALLLARDALPTAPVPWTLEKSPQPGVPRRRLAWCAACMAMGAVPGVLLGGHLPNPLTESGPGRPSTVLTATQIYGVRLALCLIITFGAVIVAGVLLRRPVPSTPTTTPTVTQPTPAPTGAGARLLDFVVLATAGLVSASAVRTLVAPQLGGAVIAMCLIAVTGVIMRLLDPRGRPGLRVPLTAVVATLTGLLAWRDLADFMLARGLGLPLGVVTADVLSRAIVIAAGVGPAVLLTALAVRVVYAVRRESFLGSALLATMMLLAASMALINGLAYVLAEARTRPIRPGHGPWSFVVDVEAVTGRVDGRAVVEDPLVVVGHVDDRAVLIPCGGGRPVVVPSSELVFESVSPETWRRCAS